MNRVEPTPNPWPALLLLGLAALLACAAPSGEVAPQVEPDALPPWATPRHPVIQVPEEDLGASTLEQRGREQIAAGAGEVFHGFVLRDRVLQSGIDFRHRVVDDAGRTYKPVHYDHGNGVAAADVDGDGFPDLYFTNQIGSNRLYRNLGNGRFEDMTERAGVGVEERISVAASFGDYDNDGDPDLFVTTVRMGNLLFRNDGDRGFTDVSEAAGVDYVGHSSGSVFFDYDGDGLLDLFVCNVGRYTRDERGRDDAFVGLVDAFSGHLFDDRNENSILYRNLGDGRFEDASVRTLLVDRSWTGDASFTDFDGDLEPDLYLLNMQGDDHYYENRDGEIFVDRSRDFFPHTPWGAMGIKFFDWDNDGRQDLMLTDMHSDMSEEIGPEREKLKSNMTWPTEMLQGPENNIWGNAFFHNRGDGVFEEISDRVGAENYWPWGLSVGDLNADGWQDVFITASMNYPFRYGVNTVLLNQRGERFHDSEFLVGVEPRRGGRTRTPWFDLDCSGEDLGHQHCAEREGSHTVMANLGSRSSVILDFDGDGDLDVVTNEFNSEPQVLVSDLAERVPLRFVALRLVGTRSNRDGLGARVTVHASGRSFTRYHDGKSGYLSQSSLPLWFALGKATTIERIEVLWPSGVSQTLDQTPSIGQTLEIVEPS